MTRHQEMLLELLQAAAAEPAAFRGRALAWVEREIGFDGAVWGTGRRLPGGMAISAAEVRGRPVRLLADFAEVAGLDPVSRGFANDPQRVWNVAVEKDYRPRRLRPVGDYLRHYRVGQLLLCGTACPGEAELSWLTLYREDRGRPFSPRAAEFAAFALPFVILAGNTAPAPPPAAPGRAPQARLSAREREVAQAYAAGADHKSVARALALSPATVRSHLLNVFRKLEVHNKIALRRRLLGE